MTVRSGDVYFGIALLFGGLCFLVSPLWTYFGNLVVGLPCLALSWTFWSLAKGAGASVRRLAIVPRVWLASGAVALVSLVVFLVTN